jgi:hypothetical protein
MLGVNYIGEFRPVLYSNQLTAGHGNLWIITGPLWG